MIGGVVADGVVVRLVVLVVGNVVVLIVLLVAAAKSVVVDGVEIAVFFAAVANGRWLLITTCCK